MLPHLFQEAPYSLPLPDFDDVTVDPDEDFTEGFEEVTITDLDGALSVLVEVIDPPA